MNDTGISNPMQINANGINDKALFCDGTKEYVIPCEPKENETVKLRFRTAKDNIDQVYLIANNQKLLMNKIETDFLFDYYEISFLLNNSPFMYYFQATLGQTNCFYDRFGFTYEEKEPNYFRIVPGFSTPDWAKGAVFYQIFVDRFCNGDITNDVIDNEYCYLKGRVTKAEDWYQNPATIGVREFYGGDLRGVIKKLDYLQGLGVEVIYLNPIFVSPSNHKYDIQDYDYVDPHFGIIQKEEGEVLTEENQENCSAKKYISRVAKKENLEASNQLFIELVQEIHNRGMRIILDGVFNHCGSFNKWMDRERIYEGEDDYAKGAYIEKESPYHTFFDFAKEEWPYNSSYEGWWGHETLPKLNYEASPKLYEYILQIAAKWVAPPFLVDGWRLDVAADLGHSEEFNHRFWQDFRRIVKEANPEAIILAEHYGDPSSWLKGNEWDTVMNYDAFMEPITWFLTGLEKHSDEAIAQREGQAEFFFEMMKKNMTRFGTSSLFTAMNELSNHDHSRFLTRTNRKVGRVQTMGSEAASIGINKAILREAVVMQMTWPGAPTIYYGDEAGVCGWTDPDNRRTYPWGREDHDLIQLHKELIRIHKDYEALRIGSTLFLTGAPGLISYGRFDRKDKVIVAVNHNPESKDIIIPVWELGITKEDRLVQLIQTSEEGFNLEAKMFQAEDGILKLTLSPFSAVIIKNFVG